jgi:sarcosine oxidase
MTGVYDLAIIGLGGIGSAVADHAARRGLNVVGFEQFASVHALGGSHGRTRMIRQAYFEAPAYVPLLQRAYAEWDDLEARSGASFFARIGVLQIGDAASTTVAGTIRAAREFDLPHDVWDAGELMRRYPQTRPLADEIGVFEPNAGAVFPEKTLTAQIDAARAAGALLHFEKRIVDWERDDAGFVLRRQDGETVRARKLALCAGAWLHERAKQLRVPIEPRRKVQAWFDSQGDAWTPEHLPAFSFLRAGILDGMLYGFPDFGDGLKAAFHFGGETTTPETIDRTVYPTDVERLRDALNLAMPGAGLRVRDASVCIYDMTPDENFVLGADPDDADLLLAFGFSGHGFKFAPAIGAVVADLAADGETGIDIEFLSVQRFRASTSSA